MYLEYLCVCGTCRVTPGQVPGEKENTSLASTSRQPSNSTVDNDPCAKSTSSQQNNSTARDSDVTSSLRPVSTNHEPSIIPEPSVEVSIELESVEAVSYITEESSVTLECDSNSFTPSIEELETEATYYSMLKSTICPDAIKTSSNLCTGIAFDNYDRFVETNDGKDTLHDTVGIIYQNIDPNISQESDTPNLPLLAAKNLEHRGKDDEEQWRLLN
ncbi:hypothetical protein EVAR_65156_1 [Eumeta japonica]|uniref:Uncharacterized protein n=1 Tax=Eumeta variegata TaxID=151549 RepID=A0A4C2AB40_EUMVA|nr:hypothetical protein EVAR_65156_1 [Eumeta japonica]